MLKIVDRFLLREIAAASAATLVVLLAIVLSSRLATYLTQVANGLLVKEVILQMLGLQSIRFLPILIPIAMLLGILLTLGRLYQDSEMVALTGCGYPPSALYRPMLMLGLPLAALVAWVALWVAPWAASLQQDLQIRARQQAQTSVFSPGTFREAGGGRHVVYVESIDPTDGELVRVFIHSRDASGDRIAITTGDRGRQEITDDGTRYMVLDHGYRYEGVPGQKDYRQTRFERLRVRLDAPSVGEGSLKREAMATADLIGGGPREYAELHARIGAAVSLPLIALVAPLLAKARPRESRYGRILGGVLVYAVYMNLLGIGKAWLEKGTLGPVAGLWWAHGLLATVGVALWIYHYGWPRVGKSA
ncbi:LPS export ABC transporter permease LptF [Plasticicumulans acidivorans]|uniref:Lipopolysaccharide export system permease protein LptF n=1 Tax=Plasticicumulans acidivorans TaxID=886464 RepID=A0A317MW14_9GAMM|nr:LPS export ABC transporter permease LptF [Plasticicumulans acidivorans]PWV58877.1 lipopolysaccharide export system permease protein [Plasticicumulans acidivorans]